MKNNNIKIIKKINLVKRKTRNKDIRFKLELFILGLKLNDITEACARRAVGRTFYYKWWKRFKSSHYKLESLKKNRENQKVLQIK